MLLLMQVKDTTPGGSCPSNSTGHGSCVEDSEASCKWAQQAVWVKTLGSMSFMGSFVCLICCYAILSLSDPFGGQQLQ